MLGVCATVTLAPAVVGPEAEAAAAAVRRAANLVGGAAALAAIAGVSIAAVYQWINGRRPVPAERAPLIERASGVPCEQLCPAVPWVLVRGNEQAMPTVEKAA